MRRLGALLAIGATLGLAGTAQARPSLHQRERAAIEGYAASQHGTAADCHIYGKRRRELACTVSVPLYMEPSHTFVADDNATIVAFPDSGSVYMVRISGWSV